MARGVQVLRTHALSADQIAERCRLSPHRVAALLKGAEPTMVELRALSQGLKVPLSAFSPRRPRTSTLSDVNPLTLFRAAAKVNAFEPTLEYIADYIDAAVQLLPTQPKEPYWFNHFSVESETFEEAHRLAHLVRELLFADRVDEPILDLPTILSNEGLTHISLLKKSRYEGASVTMGGYVFIFVSPRFRARMLFTIAHELGHVLTHHSQDNPASFDKSSQIGRIGRTTRSERFVDAFASVLLVPDQAIGRFLQAARDQLDIRDDSLGDIEVLLMARYYGVSFEVAARRCEDLELLPRGGAYSMVQKLKEEYGSPEKRAEFVELPVRREVKIARISPHLSAAVMEAVEEGRISIGWAADKFGLSVGELVFEHAKSTRTIRC